MIEPGSTIGIIGGGQLGRMSAMAARQMGYLSWVLEQGETSPAGQVADGQISRSYEDPDALHGLITLADVITYEFENIPADPLLDCADCGVPFRPDPSILALSQNREREKVGLNARGYPTARFEIIEDACSLRRIMEAWRTEAVLKTCVFGYDGKGQVKVSSPAESREAWEELGSQRAILEEWVDYVAEYSVIVARNPKGQCVSYPLFENIHRNHTLDATISPANLDKALAEEARRMGEDLARDLKLEGVLCIELFLTRDSKWLINEIAPRPHNSGHCTIEANQTSQFEQHIRAIADLPLGETSPRGQAMMINLLGDLWDAAPPPWEKLLEIPEAKLHLYGKPQPKPGRKMGHLTLLCDTRSSLIERGLKVREILSLPPLIFEP